MSVAVMNFSLDHGEKHRHNLINVSSLVQIKELSFILRLCLFSNFDKFCMNLFPEDMVMACRPSRHPESEELLSTAISSLAPEFLGPWEVLP